MRAWWWLLVLPVALAGCSDAAPSPASATVEEPAASPPGPVLETVEMRQAVLWEGRTKEGFFVCSDQAGTGTCPAGQQVQPDGQHATRLAYEANLTRIDVNLTWQADPSQTGLVLAVYGNASGPVFLGSVRGVSPLQFALDPEDLVPDGELFVIVWPEGKTPTEPSVFVDVTRQAFRLEGVFTLQDAVWVTPASP